MDGDTDRLLGELIAKADESARKQAAIFTKLDNVTMTLSELNGALKLHVVQDDAKHENIASRIMAMEPHVEDFKRTKQRGIGMLIGASAGGGTAGAGLMAFLSKFFGGGS